MNADKKIRVMVVDDHDMVRKGLATFLKVKQDLELVGEAGDGEEALRLCEQVKPDVVLMDLMMPRMDGPAAIRTIRQRFPQIHVIALTSFTEKDTVQSALQAGAVGYLLKNVSANDLAEAIRAASAGRSTLAPEAIQSLVKAGGEPTVPNYGLTTREREVLSLMSEGLSNQEIAQRLVVSLSTAKAHVSNILAKLGVASRSEAISLALKNKLV